MGLELDVTEGSAVFVCPKGDAHGPASFAWFTDPAGNVLALIQA
ncbi:hypothetical protein [Isoptericola rhizosphaerae]